MVENMSATNKVRCQWVNSDPIYINYHDYEWGVPVYEEQLLFEFLILEGMQAGLNWLTILKKRDNYRSCFENFDPYKLVKYKPTQLKKILANPGIVRNKLKVEAIITNAIAFCNLKQEKKDFSQYLWGFVNGIPIQNKWKHFKQVPTSNKISDQLSADLKKRSFKFVGSTICYAFMQAVGMVNDHTLNCFRHQEVKKTSLLSKS